jgi:hypothetical protein
MSLSNATFNKLADALKSEVVSYILQDERYVEFLMDMIPDAIQEKLGGPMDDIVLYELSLCVMEKIELQ